MADMQIRIEILGVQHSINVPANATFTWLSHKLEDITRGSGMAITRDNQYISILVSISYKISVDGSCSYF